jgi:hypothetical protein
MIAISRTELTADLRSEGVTASQGVPAAAEIQEAQAQAAAKRIAIFAVHGISPIQRYAFQDQVATAFQCYLNAQESAVPKRTWDAIVHWPKVANEGPGASDSVRPSSLRIYRSDDNPDAPTGKVYDVYEGYWSPYSKGKTNISSALRWLLNATFLGTSSTANIPCTPAKLRSDLFYIVALLGGALLACAVALGLGWAAWILLSQMLPSAANVTYQQLLQDPFHTLFRLPLVVYVEFIIDLIIGYILAQIIVVYKVSRERDARTNTLRSDSAQQGPFANKTLRAHAFHRTILWILWLTFAALLAVAIGIAMFPGNFQIRSPFLVVSYIALLTLAVIFLQFARAMADFAVEDLLGDVQIYTTHDNNSTFYAIRQQIIAAVASSLRGVLSAVVDPTKSQPEPYYDAIHIFGHSLGSTISMDVLIRLREMIQQGSVARQQWEKIRSFTTFGAALEKTRFFFDVRQPTLNAAQDQWENDVYGRFFTDDPEELKKPPADAGIYWSNHWYFHDIVANAIVSYQSDVAVGTTFRWSQNALATRLICNDFELPHDRPRFSWVHSDYLADPLFWANAGRVLTS